jgi:predicted anti-sigma-YlaC factor YlaD
MISDRHELFRNMIDETLVVGTSASPQPELNEHLQSCAHCREYLETTTRAIASLGSFSFEVDPTLQAKVANALTLRAQQLEPARFSPARLVMACILAVALTVVGSFFDLKFGGLLASVLDLHHAQLRHGLLTFWIIPSLCLLLLFPMLPLLSRRKERTL